MNISSITKDKMDNFRLLGGQRPHLAKKPWVGTTHLSIYLPFDRVMTKYMELVAEGSMKGAKN